MNGDTRRAHTAVVCVSHSPQMDQDAEQVQGLEFRTGVRRITERVREFDPTLVIFFGCDHMRAFTEIAPCFTVVAKAQGYGDWGTSEADYLVPPDLPEQLARHLVDHGVDVALAKNIRLDHGVSQTMRHVMGGVDVVPVIPVVINTIGVPTPTMTRVAEMGRLVGTFVATTTGPDDRVLFVASGGLSHSPPSLIPGAERLTEPERQALIHDNLAKAAEAINPDWDERLLRLFQEGDSGGLEALTNDDMLPGGTGGNEVRTWVAAAFAGGETLATVAYQPVREWITGMAVAASPALV
jgi:2,3-dihydroxyphenylpropionate 1,2-dioxygenase